MARRSSTTSRGAYGSDATQTAILDAAEEEFAEHGLVGAYTEAIASRSGVTKTMIYYYFDNKEGLYLAVLKRLFVKHFCLVNEMNFKQYTPEKALEEFLNQFLSAISLNPNFPKIMLHESLQNKGKYYKQIGVLFLYKKLKAILERGMASSAFRKLEPQHVAVDIVGTCVFYFCVSENIKHLWPKKQLFSEEMLEMHKREAINLILAGVKLDEGSA
jgi:AcrR family transcriptional regulator